MLGLDQALNRFRERKPAFDKAARHGPTVDFNSANLELRKEAAEQNCTLMQEDAVPSQPIASTSKYQLNI